MPQNTSPSKSVGKQKAAINSQGEASKKENRADAKMPTASASVKPDYDKSPYHCEITCKPDKNWGDKFKPFVEIAGLILLMVYTIYTIKLYHANKESADAAKVAADAGIIAANTGTDALIASNRAWMRFTLKPPWGDTRVGFLNALKVTKYFYFEGTVENFGKTPATGAQNETMVELLDDIEDPSFDYSKPHPIFKEELFYPGQTDTGVFASISDMSIVPDTFWTNVRPRLIAPEVRKQLETGKKYFVIYGRGAYRDDFGEYRFQWCKLFTANESVLITKPVMGKCVDYNAAFVTKRYEHH